MIEYYAKMTEKMAVRERRALWKTQRYRLSGRRNTFLQQEELQLFEELQKLKDANQVKTFDSNQYQKSKGLSELSVNFIESVAVNRGDENNTEHSSENTEKNEVMNATSKALQQESEDSADHRFPDGNSKQKPSQNILVPSDPSNTSDVNLLQFSVCSPEDVTFTIEEPKGNVPEDFIQTSLAQTVASSMKIAENAPHLNVDGTGQMLTQVGQERSGAIASLQTNMSDSIPAGEQLKHAVNTESTDHIQDTGTARLIDLTLDTNTPAVSDRILDAVGNLLDLSLKDLPTWAKKVDQNDKDIKEEMEASISSNNTDQKFPDSETEESTDAANGNFAVEYSAKTVLPETDRHEVFEKERKLRHVSQTSAKCAGSGIPQKMKTPQHVSDETTPSQDIGIPRKIRTSHHVSQMSDSPLNENNIPRKAKTTQHVSEVSQAEIKLIPEKQKTAHHVTEMSEEGPLAGRIPKQPTAAHHVSEQTEAEEFHIFAKKKTGQYISQESGTLKEMWSQRKVTHSDTKMASGFLGCEYEKKTWPQNRDQVQSSHIPREGSTDTLREYCQMPKRNIHGHASDATVQNILYQDLDTEITVKCHRHCKTKERLNLERSEQQDDRLQKMRTTEYGQRPSDATDQNCRVSGEVTGTNTFLLKKWRRIE